MTDVALNPDVQTEVARASTFATVTDLPDNVLRSSAMAADSGEKSRAASSWKEIVVEVVGRKIDAEVVGANVMFVVGESSEEDPHTLTDRATRVRLITRTSRLIRTPPPRVTAA